MRGEGKLPEQFERKVSLAGSNGCALNALMLSAALGFTEKLAKKQIVEEILPKQLVLLQVVNAKHRKRCQKKKIPGRKLPLLFSFCFSLKSTSNIGKKGVD